MQNMGNLQPVVTDEPTPAQEVIVQERFAQNLQKREQEGKPITVAVPVEPQEKGLKYYAKQAQKWIVRHPVRSTGIALLVGFAIGRVSKRDSEPREYRQRSTRSEEQVSGLSGVGRPRKRKKKQAPKKRKATSKRK